MDDNTLQLFGSVWGGASQDDETAFNFKDDLDFNAIFGEEYMRNQFPGFDDHVYEILAREGASLDVKELFVEPKVSVDGRRGDSAVKNISAINNEV